MNADAEIQTEAAVVAELAERAATPNPVAEGDVALLVLRDASGAQRTETVDAERFLDRPRRRHGRVVALDAESFGRIVVDLGPQNGRTAIYADVKALTLTAVLNDHEGGEDDLSIAGWQDHRVSLSIVRTPQWERWLSLNEKLSEQTTFATHLEENMADVVDPPGADLLELAQSFEATIDAQFKSAARLKDGARQFTYTEVIDARAGKDGQIVVPEGFTLSISPVEGADPVTVRAKLRFRLNSGQLRIGYVLEDPAGVERTAFDDVVAKVETATSIKPYKAQAPA